MSGGISLSPPGSLRKVLDWELAQPTKVEVTLDHQCYPLERRVPRYGRPFHDVALAMQKSGVSAYDIAQTLSGVASFWAQVSRGDKDVDEFDHRHEKKHGR